MSRLGRYLPGCFHVLRYSPAESWDYTIRLGHHLYLFYACNFSQTCIASKGDNLNRYALDLILRHLCFVTLIIHGLNFPLIESNYLGCVRYWSWTSLEWPSGIEYMLLVPGDWWHSLQEVFNTGSTWQSKPALKDRLFNLPTVSSNQLCSSKDLRMRAGFTAQG